MQKTPSRWLRLEQFCASAFSSSSYRFSQHFGQVGNVTPAWVRL
jgi:hypothetical protein